MSPADLPAIADLVPHEGSMVMLSRVLHHEEDHTVCLAEIDAQTLFRDPLGDVPAWVGLEYMAQCIAVHGGLVGRASGEPVRIGLLLGSRRVSFHVPRFRCGQTLEVVARRVWGRSRGMVCFDCALRDAESGAVLGEGRLNCFMTEGGHLPGGDA